MKILKNILFLNSYRLRFCKHAFALNFDILPCSLSLKIVFSVMVGVVLKVYVRRNERVFPSKVLFLVSEIRFNILKRSTATKSTKFDSLEKIF